MAKSSTIEALAKKQVKKFASNWQRCRQQELPDLFYAYDQSQQQSERAVTYRLSGKALEKFYQSVPANEQFRFIVHLGLRNNHYSAEIPDEPAFVLLLQAYTKKKDWQQGCFPLSWEANSRFSGAQEDGTTSEANAIPAAGAYLFIMSWLETPEERLAEPFTAVSHVLGRRVKAYAFSSAESKSIYDDLTNSLKSKAPALDIHLGRGLAVYDHPFSFRPVVEVKRAVDVAKPGSNARNATGLTNDDGDSFYDFSNPIPPSDL